MRLKIEQIQRDTKDVTRAADIEIEEVDSLHNNDSSIN